MKYMLSTFIPNTIVERISLLCLLKIFLTIPLVGQSIQFSLHDGSQLTEAGSAFDNKTRLPLSLRTELLYPLRHSLIMIQLMQY